MIEGLAGAQANPEPIREAVRTSHLKMENPVTFDGKSPATFNQWWESVTKYLGFYPETVDRQKITWVGTLLTDTALVWHVHRYRELRDNDTWVNYLAAIRTEYRNEREAADAQLKLGQLRYQGDIRAYMTEFRALNNYARATGESLREKINLAMPDSILDMRFAHYLENFADNEGFLQATYQVALQVEKKKALKSAREHIRAQPGTSGKREDGKKEEKGKENRPRGSAVEEAKKEPRTENRRTSEYGGTERWGSEAAAFEGVPVTEKREHMAGRGCHRCGRSGHQVAQCFVGASVKGTNLPAAPWKKAAGTKRQREPEEEEETPSPAPKVQKTVAADTMDTEPMWESEEDF